MEPVRHVEILMKNVAKITFRFRWNQIKFLGVEGGLGKPYPYRLNERYWKAESQLQDKIM